MHALQQTIRLRLFDSCLTGFCRFGEGILRTKRHMTELYAQHCGRTYEDVERTLDRDFFMTAKEAKDWGLVDHVFDTRKQAAA